ncbi:HAMP domain-containing sensor histidine kinase [Streptomyces aureocirculatus]|uniref:HAMP domain-containing sensor histidine kinase n=1 Tax=Streptomyces aureocirculatus TaxID=67275 RepID=UPI0004C47F56|nr:HAMP domain-containing sensor histidine kinase [Streptomyces aureocirculatus]
MRWPVAPVSSLATTFAALFAAVAVAVTLLVGFLSYDAAARLVRRDQQTQFAEVVQELRSQVRQRSIDTDDYVIVTDLDHDGVRDDLTRPARSDAQIIDPGGRVVGRGTPRMPVSGADRGVAAHRQPGMVTRRDLELGDGDYRMATVSLGGGRGAVQLAQRYSDTEDLLHSLQRRTLLLASLVVVAAGLSGWWLARRVTRRLVRLARAAEDVAATGRVDRPVPVAGRDEVGRLGRSFDRMLGRLARAEDDQRRLVQDAGHELRTPLTSLRTNIALLDRIDALPPQARTELVTDLADESRELTDLVNELVELAAGRQDDEQPADVALAGLAEEAASLARRRTGRTITVDAAGAAVVRARPVAVQRAVTNLLENAAKFDRDGTAPIELTVRGARIDVRDRGPGVSAGDLGRIFDRFYRADDARSLPGSGLGLAIVREVATAHGGRVFAHARPGGGTVVGFTVGPA